MSGGEAEKVETFMAIVDLSYTISAGPPPRPQTHQIGAADTYVKLEIQGMITDSSWKSEEREVHLQMHKTQKYRLLNK